jgi:hypothetical protein
MTQFLYAVRSRDWPSQLPPSRSLVYATSDVTGMVMRLPPLLPSCSMEIRPPSGATFTAAMVFGRRGATLARRWNPASSTRYTCSKNMCPNGSISMASRRCSDQENRSFVRATSACSVCPTIGSPRSADTSAATSGRHPVASSRHAVRRIGSVTARRTDATCASWRRIAS